MQPFVDGPRLAIPEATLTSILMSAPIVHGYGLELTDLSLLTLADISINCQGGEISRASYASLHGTGKLDLTTDLDWGSAVVRPYYTLTDGTTKARWNLGAYFTSTPAESTETSPDHRDVDLYDILSILDDPVPDTYVVPAGTLYLTAVEDILKARKVQRYRVDNSARTTALPGDRVWKFDAQLTWLLIVNDLLASIGYMGIYSDWDGNLVCQQYTSPRDRGSEWTYDATTKPTMLGRVRRRIRDYYKAYNSWVFYKGTGLDTDTPVEGNGRYSFTNYTVGETSVNARGGRVITRPPEALDVADHASLVATAQRIIDNDMIVPTRFETTTAPHPGHWHFDRLTVIDPVFGPPADVVGSKWTLPLDGHIQTHEWTVL